MFPYFSHLQLYELDGDPKRKEFLDDLFGFMQRRGEPSGPVSPRGEEASRAELWEFSSPVVGSSSPASSPHWAVGLP